MVSGTIPVGAPGAGSSTFGGPVTWTSPEAGFIVYKSSTDDEATTPIFAPDTPTGPASRRVSNFFHHLSGTPSASSTRAITGWNATITKGSTTQSYYSTAYLVKHFASAGSISFDIPVVPINVPLRNAPATWEELEGR